MSLNEEVPAMENEAEAEARRYKRKTKQQRREKSKGILRTHCNIK
jgi:hypothetical protein